MYTDQDFQNVKKSLMKFVIGFIAATAVVITIIVLNCVNWGTEVDPIRWTPWISYIISGIWAIGTVFCWGMFGSRIIHYMKYLNDIRLGLDREIAGVVKGMHGNEVQRQGLEFYEIQIDEETDNPDEPDRIVYYDMAKGEPSFKIGDKVKLVLFGNFVKDVI